MEILEPNEDNRLTRQSSTLQHEGMLAVRRGNQWAPIAYDAIDGIVCDKILAHKAVLTRKPYMGYSFPVEHCKYTSQSYIKSDQKGTELKVLDDFYGTGFYESAYDRKVLVNSDNGALGERNTITTDVGLDYVLAKSSLDPVD